MSIPPFVLALRERVGHDMLWLPGATAVVLCEDGPRPRVLLVRRADTGEWTPVTGIVDPGEDPAVAAVREVREEADVVAVAERLAQVSVIGPVVYDNGDRSQYLDLTFRCRWVSGDPFPADGENTDARWWDLDDLPAMSPSMTSRLQAALPARGEAEFVA
ncbi:NUDIX hydrolase [Cellulomonas wangsupingiae]|uniref:NUDIX hydrolase n=1 Tax=Cellulomonas wangsupingiae TaxID=2968085 RepID=UPI001D0E27FA|nr:NUDIX domain-containing protein [Cellulomonas wangsupingiae]MCM0639974.1 NUDIX domain-containing protein [Cellulomonas wangsupingiae]